MAKRVYEVWKGSNVFFLDGRLIFGPDARSLFATLFLIIVPVVIFCVFVAIHLRHAFSPYNVGYAVLVVAIIFTIYVMVLLFLTSARDPGIVPRNAHPSEEDLRYDTSVSMEVGGRQTPSVQIPRTKEVMVNGIPVRVKYCDTCMLYRPPRCSHCSICNNCVSGSITIARGWANASNCATTASSFYLFHRQRFFVSMCLPCQQSTLRF